MKWMLSIGLVLLASTTVTAKDAAKEVAKDEWIKGMEKSVPAYMCGEERYYRQCFKVTQAECEKTARSVTKTCLAQNKDKFPALFKQPEDGAKWGPVIGDCAELAYGTALKKKFTGSKKCGDPTVWK